MAKDNRIPPYGMAYAEARKRNALPVPATQYGNPGSGGVFNYWDQVSLNPPAGAAYATIELLYQPTSWEYIQFLYLANDGSKAFLANEGAYLLDAWLNTGMADPYVMASTTWGQAPQPPTQTVIVSGLSTWLLSKSGAVAPATSFAPGTTVGVKAHVVGATGVPLSGAQVFVEIRNALGQLVTTLQGFSDPAGDALARWISSRKQPVGTYTAHVTQILKGGYVFDPDHSTLTVTFTIH